MATIIRTIEFVDFHTTASMHLPERVKISCPHCGKELGKDCILAFYTSPGPDPEADLPPPERSPKPKSLPDVLNVGVVCAACGFLAERPTIVRLY